MNTPWRLIGIIAAFTLLIGGVAKVVFQWQDSAEGEKEPRTLRFDQTLAEGVNVHQHGYYGIDFIRCGVCRIEKRKLGAMIFGGFNTLVLEDLSIVLPTADGNEMLSMSMESRGSRGHEGVNAKELAARLGISNKFIKMRGGDLKFSGLKVTNFEFATLDAATNVCPRFFAAFGEAKRDGLYLNGCGITENSVSNRIGNAVLKIKPNLRLVWSGGALKI